MVAAFYNKARAYSVMMQTRPQTIGYALTDSPVGLAAFIYDYNNGEPERLLTEDQVLDDITLYWLTNTATSSARLYWENQGLSPISAAAEKTADVSLPVAITVFPDEIYQAPETGARRAYPNLAYFHEVVRAATSQLGNSPNSTAQSCLLRFSLCVKSN
jgi:hypothetical protein